MKPRSPIVRLGSREQAEVTHEPLAFCGVVGLGRLAARG